AVRGENAVMLALGGRRGGNGAVRLGRRGRRRNCGRELEAAHVAAACERDRRTQQRCRRQNATAHSPVSPFGRPIHFVVLVVRRITSRSALRFVPPWPPRSAARG